MRSNYKNWIEIRIYRIYLWIRLVGFNFLVEQRPRFEFGKPIKVNGILTNNGNEAREYISHEALRTVCRYAHVGAALISMKRRRLTCWPGLFAVGPSQSCSYSFKVRNVDTKSTHVGVIDDARLTISRACTWWHSLSLSLPLSFSRSGRPRWK